MDIAESRPNKRKYEKTELCTLLSDQTAMYTLLEDMKQTNQELFDQFHSYIKSTDHVRKKMKQHHWQFQIANDIVYQIFNYTSMKTRLAVLSSVCQHWNECVFSPPSWKCVDIHNFIYKSKSCQSLIDSNVKNLYLPNSVVGLDMHVLFQNIQTLHIEYNISFIELFNIQWKQLRELNLESKFAISKSNKSDIDHLIRKFHVDSICCFPLLESITFGRFIYILVNEQFQLLHIHTPNLKKLSIVNSYDALNDTSIEFISKVEYLSIFLARSSTISKVFAHPNCKIKHVKWQNYNMIQEYNHEDQTKPIYLDTQLVMINYYEHFPIPIKNWIESKKSKIHIEKSKEHLHKKSKICLLDQKMILFPKSINTLTIEHCHMEDFYSILKSNKTIDDLIIDFEIEDPDEIFYLVDIHCNIKSLTFLNYVEATIPQTKRLTLEHIIYIRKHICNNFFYTKPLCDDDLKCLSNTDVEFYEYIKQSKWVGKVSHMQSDMWDHALQTLLQFKHIIETKDKKYKVNPDRMYDYKCDYIEIVD